MASNTENCPSEPSETELKQSAALEEKKRDEVFFTQTEVLLSVETKQELQTKLKRWNVKFWSKQKYFCPQESAQEGVRSAR